MTTNHHWGISFILLEMFTCINRTSEENNMQKCHTLTLFTYSKGYRVKSGIFGQTAKFGQPPCLFHSSIIGIKKNNYAKQ